MDQAATIIQANFRGHLSRKRNRDIDLVFGALVAEVESDKLLHFWDREAISRRVSSQSKNKNLKSSQKANSTDFQSISPRLNSPEFQEPNLIEKLNINTSPEKILTDAGFKASSLTGGQLKDKRFDLLSELWWLQSAIISRRKSITANSQPRIHLGHQ